MQALLDHLAQMIGLVCCLIILVRAEPAINRMSHRSPPLVRFAFALLVTGALAGILAILTGTVPDRTTLIILAGTAALTVCERRVRLLSGPHYRPYNQTRKGLPDAQG